MTEVVLEFAAFIFFVFAILYIPGKFLLHKLELKLSSLENLFLPAGLGLVLFTFVSYVFSWARVDILILPFFLVIDYVGLRSREKLFTKIEKKHILPLVIVAFLSAVFSLSMVITGKFGDTLVYRHDDPWHLALINELKANFPPDNPGFSGIPLRGYHFFYDFALAKISNIFLISPLSLHFRLFPVLMAFLLGLGTYILTFTWSRRVSASLWAVFLTMFGGSFAYVLALLGHDINIGNGLNMSQPVLTLYNPPLAASIIILLVALFALYQYLNTRVENWLVPLALCAGMISMFKVYAGIILLGGLLLLTLMECIKKRYAMVLALGAAGILFLATYWLFAGGAGYLIFYPLWPSQRLLMSFAWYGYEEKIYTYMQRGVVKGILQTELYGVFLFLVGGLGSRMLGIILLSVNFLKKRKLPSMFSLIVLVMTAISILLPLFFIQSGKVFEIIQMTHYFVFFASLFAAFGFSAFFTLRYPKILKVLLALLLIAATLPVTYEAFRGFPNIYQSSRNITDPYFKTMDFLSLQEDYNATVLELPLQSVEPDEKKLQEWYSRVSTPEIIAFANKRSYISNQFIEFPGVNKDARLRFLKTVLLFNKTSETDPLYAKLKKEVGEGLRKNNIRYIYSPYEIGSLTRLEKVKSVYKNMDHTVYRIGE